MSKTKEFGRKVQGILWVDFSNRKNKYYLPCRIQNEIKVADQKLKNQFLVLSNFKG
jgi:hypothetical protein